MNDDNTCPRCGGGIPNNLHRGEYPGALSRTDNGTYVCSQCGQTEAIEQFTNGAPMPQSKWFVNADKPEPKVRITVRTPKVNVIRDFTDAQKGYDWMTTMIADGDVISIDVTPITEKGM